MSETVTIAILVFDRVEEMDFVGPWEVLNAIRDVNDALRVVLVAPRHGVITCEKGVRIIPDHDFTDAPDPDVVLVPGGTGARLSIDDPDTVAWLRRISPGCIWVTSVCTGALLLAGAGLIGGRRATTHHEFTDTLAAFGDCEVVTGARMVRDGNLITAGGVMSGIEMSLWLAKTMFGAKAEAYVRNYIAYDFPPREALNLTGRSSG